MISSALRPLKGVPAAGVQARERRKLQEVLRELNGKVERLYQCHVLEMGVIAKQQTQVKGLAGWAFRGHRKGVHGASKDPYFFKWHGLRHQCLHYFYARFCVLSRVFSVSRLFNCSSLIGDVGKLQERLLWDAAMS